MWRITEKVRDPRQTMKRTVSHFHGPKTTITTTMMTSSTSRKKIKSNRINN